MADSFFGFNTTLPDDEGGGDDRENEEEYDALNDETFGDAINGDWEGLHENFVRLDRHDIKNGDGTIKNASKDFDHDSDLELNLSRFELEDCDVAADDFEGRLQLDPSVWSSPAKPMLPQPVNDNFNIYSNPEMFIHRNFSQPFNNFPQQSVMHQLNAMGNLNRQQIGSPFPTNSSQPTIAKIISVEDVERNIRNQSMSKQALAHQVSQNSAPTSVADIVSSIHSQLTNTPRQSQQIQAQQLPRHGNGPPGLMMPSQNPRPMFPPPPPHQISPNRLPPGFPPHPLMGVNHPQGHHQPPPPNMGRHMPQNMHMPMHPMHPNFGPPIRHGGPPQHPPLPMQMQQHLSQQQHQQRIMQGGGQMQPSLPNHFPPNHFQNIPNLQNSVNQFNKRLVQEIQQNHPLLQQFNRLNNNIGNGNQNNYVLQSSSMMQNSNMNTGNNNHNKQHHNNNRHNGNGAEYDEYANLMSTRDKHWLIGIQLMQLSTETPYIDDFYYTVYKERQKKSANESKTYKDNTLNHPLTQPKGHAQLLMLLGKNGTINQRNGHQNNRERKSSESSTTNKNDKEQTPRTYTPLQFEKSLGKLQCGSVTAPRKIIDMDIVGPEISNALNASSLEITIQRRSRQLLLHIETLYKIVLKMEDLENPTAVASAVILKEKREKERQLALEQAMIDELIGEVSSANNVETAQRGLGGTLGGNPMSTVISDNMPEPETMSELVPKLFAGLTTDKVIAMMNVRKGKTLIRRILPLIRDHTQRWDIWCDIFSTLCIIAKKDPDDIDGLLISLYPEFRNQIQYAGMDEILRISLSLVAGHNEKKLSSIVESKFCILAIIAMILRVEQFYQISQDLVDANQKTKWLYFLNNVGQFNINNNIAQRNKTTQGTGGNGSGGITSMDGDLVKSLVKHFSRFRELKAQQLLVVLSQVEMK